MYGPLLFDSYRSATAGLSAHEIVGAVVNPPYDYSLILQNDSTSLRTTQHDTVKPVVPIKRDRSDKPCKCSSDAARMGNSMVRLTLVVVGSKGS
jgi:hypothetical protein